MPDSDISMGYVWFNNGNTSFAHMSLDIYIDNVNNQTASSDFLLHEKKLKPSVTSDVGLEPNMYTYPFNKNNTLTLSLNIFYFSICTLYDNK